MTQVRVKAWTKNDVATGVIPFIPQNTDMFLFEQNIKNIYNPNVIVMQSNTTRNVKNIYVSKITLNTEENNIIVKARGNISSTILMKFVIELAVCIKQMLNSNSNVSRKSINLIINDNIPFNLILPKC